MAAPRKPLRLSEKVVRFPKIVECDNIELDSLEEYSESDEQNVSDKHVLLANTIRLHLLYVFKTQALGFP